MSDSTINRLIKIFSSGSPLSRAFGSLLTVSDVGLQIVVNAIVETLKTAFPRSEPLSPTEDGDAEPDGKTQLDTKKNKYAVLKKLKTMKMISLMSTIMCLVVIKVAV